MYEELGVHAVESYSQGNENYAYLVGWAAGCISKTIIKEKQNDI